MILAELVVRLSPGTGGAVRLQVGETFVDLALVTHTGDPTAVWVAQRRHQETGTELKIILKVEMRYCTVYCPRRVCPTTVRFRGERDRPS